MYRVYYYDALGSQRSDGIGWDTYESAAKAAKTLSRHGERCSFVMEFSTGHVVAEFIGGKIL